MMIQIPDYFRCTKCGLRILYEEAGQMECGKCVFDDWEPKYDDESDI
ncbi:hypothetical protein [Saccharococcus thermophilus]|uniref:DNA-directed RNA polymerase subunit RPC12/RpoP n=1 Tax=Saccharococcus thermophilus TaxID=29396 RepID=A0A846MIS7_9BACL|nr:hypothetical protein [Saccharococcus thermophilus]NIK15315.1 DNA-directed RNA polymerase subunit RPC12/RpoP [Saccharococcus thermophilus]